MSKKAAEQENIQATEQEQASEPVNGKEVTHGNEQAAPVIISTPSGNYVKIQDEDGKWKRKAVYSAFSSVTPETREQKVKLMNLLNSPDEATGLSDCVGEVITVADVIINPYDRVNEDTGAEEYGALTYLLTPEGQAYVTSSKSVYFTMKRVFQVFGEPHYGKGEEVKVSVVELKGRENKYIDLKIIG